MTQSDEIRILLPADQNIILDYEQERLATRIEDPMERELAGWSARWRAEALEHYLRLGWSYGLFREGRLQGYLISQPVLFFRGHMQTLWIEHLSGVDQDVVHTLIDTAYKWARDKHFQCLLFDGEEHVSVLGQWKQAQKVEGHLIELKCAKY